MRRAPAQGPPRSQVGDRAGRDVGAPTYSGRVSHHSETLLDLSLARTTLIRDLSDRDGQVGLDRALADPRTRVVEIRGDRAPIAAPTEVRGAARRLVYREPQSGDGADGSDGGQRADRVLVLLGRDGDGTRYVAQLREATNPEAHQPPSGAEADEHGRHWLTLREVGTELDDTDTGVLTSAMALAQWHRRNPYCPRCGSRTVPVDGGWVRRCPQDGSEHYPRTDAAVIVAVTDQDDRLLLAQGVGWAQRRMSLLAGFVEAGETLEAAVVREVGEEVGVRLTDVTYRGNQPWPFPASLMIGFSARALGTELRLQAEEIAAARWFSREELSAAVAAEQVILPHRISIARSLIEQWFGGPLDGTGTHRPRDEAKR